MRPLYVEGGHDVTLRLDGPSLVVESPGAALRRFPLNRLSHVVLIGAVRTDLAALRACAQAGVPVGALDARGMPAGFFLPWKPEPPAASTLLEQFLSRPGWQSRWSDWRRSQQRRAMIRALRAAGLSPHENDSADAAFRALLHQSGRPEQAIRVLRAWHSLSAPVAHRCLAERGFCPTLVAGRMPAFDLPQELTDINAWDHFEALRRLPGWPHTSREIVAAYETARPRDQNRMRTLVDHFLFWLGGVRWQ